uniref:Oligosaccharyltransferase complex subunit n=1 Tax=Ascaris lumbricoides TaxID=6252 RepID=A0A0M3IB49_ASCLU
MSMNDYDRFLLTSNSDNLKELHYEQLPMFISSGMVFCLLTIQSLIGIGKAQQVDYGSMNDYDRFLLTSNSDNLKELHYEQLPMFISSGMVFCLLTIQSLIGIGKAQQVDYGSLIR